MNKLYLPVAALAMVAIWVFWPLLVAFAVGIGPLDQLKCDRIDVIAKVGDTYGSLNTAVALIVAAFAAATFRTQTAQIRALEEEQRRGRLLALVSLYYSLDPNERTRERLAILAELERACRQLPVEKRSAIQRLVVPHPAELQTMRDDAALNLGDSYWLRPTK